MNLKHLIPNSWLIIVRKGFHDTNAAHWIALEVIWLAILVIVVGVVCRGAAVSLVEIYWWMGLSFNLAAAMWIGAGVIYKKPVPAAPLVNNGVANTGAFSTILALETHVVKTFGDASRHCVIGLCLFVVGNLLQVAEKFDFMKSLG